MKNQSNSISTDYPIIVHCHLRWDGVWQRPQQFLSRFAKTHPVLFVEGPTLRDGNEAPTFTLHDAPNAENVKIMQTQFPASKFHDGAWVDAERLRLLKEALNGPLKGKYDKAVQWFYDPMAAPCFIGKIDEIAVVYDCMDELSQFKFAPPEIIARERELLAKADVCFTGGRKMWQSKSRFNNNCHFYGCGVDVAHFSKARQDATEVPQDIAHLKGPVFGYFGVVDERMDYELVRKIAEANKEWQVVIIGPACKVNPDDFPKAANIHWLGRREYAQLPGYTKGFDVCLMPFALNEATEYINPTKALEYMATGRPIVSTAVPDVISNFGKVVKVAYSHDEFIDYCRKAVDEPDEKAIQDGLTMANENQWHTIVEKMEGHIATALRNKQQRAKEQEQEVATATA